MKLWIKIFVSFVVIPSFAVGFFYYLNSRGFFNLNQIQILVEDSSHSKPALRKSVERLNTQLEAMRGQPLWSLNLKLVSQTLADEKWVQAFHITRRWPTTLQVTVKPQDLEYVYINSQGQILPVMENGFFLDPLKAGDSPDLPIAVGSEFEKSQDVRVKAVEILKQIPLHGSFSRATISEIQHDPKNGFSFSLVQSGLRVQLGEEKVHAKSFRVSKVLDYLENKKFQARVIDANLSQKVLVRLRKDP
jgi:cell division protein FtsQ